MIALPALHGRVVGRLVDFTDVLAEDNLTLIALEGYGDAVFMQIKLWSRRAQELASESLYDEPPSPDSSAG